MVVRVFDDVPEHLFRVEVVSEDCLTSFAVTGPLAGICGDPISIGVLSSSDKIFAIDGGYPIADAALISRTK